MTPTGLEPGPKDRSCDHCTMQSFPEEGLKTKVCCYNTVFRLQLNSGPSLC